MRGKRWRRRTRLVLALAVALIGFVAQADTGVARANLNLRQRPDFRAKVVAVIPAGGSVRIRTCTNGWCAVTWRKERGWVSQSYLKVDRPVARPKGRGYINSAGEWVPSPRASPNGPPAGASAQCNDGKYSFSKSRRGTCSHHGGVRRWL